MADYNRSSPYVLLSFLLWGTMGSYGLKWVDFRISYFSF